MAAISTTNPVFLTAVPLLQTGSWSCGEKCETTIELLLFISFCFVCLVQDNKYFDTF
jgi:hypothetical protein